MKTRPIQQSQSARKPYQKASMHIIEIDAVDVLTTSGATTRQIDGFVKESTNDWFESPSVQQ